MTIDFEWVITHVPELVMPVLPGYVFLVCFKFCGAGSRGYVKPVSVESLIASYIVTLLYTGLKASVGAFCSSVYEKAPPVIQAVISFARNIAQNVISNTIIPAIRKTSRV